MVPSMFLCSECALQPHRFLDNRFLDNRFIDNRFLDNRFIDHVPARVQHDSARNERDSELVLSAVDHPQMSKQV